MSEEESSQLEYGADPSAYECDVVESPIRRYGEWPVVRSLLPPLDDQTVLDAGCGTGWTAAELAAAGATVVGVDASAGMVAYANETYGDRAAFEQADLRERLPFEDGRFDVVLSQFTLELLEDWSTPADEFERVLAPGGSLVVSTNHPFVEYLMTAQDELPDFETLFDADGQPRITSPVEDHSYFDVEPYGSPVEDEDPPRDVPFYRRSVAAVLRPFLDRGFSLSALREVGPTEELSTAAPEVAEALRDEPPIYLCLRFDLPAEA